MEYAIGYISIVFALQAVAAVRTPHTDCQAVIVGSVFWPLMIVLIAGSFFLDMIDVGFDMVKVSKMFGVRKPTTPGLKGIAITLFYVEFQIWSMKKA